MNLIGSALTTGSTNAFRCYGHVLVTAVGTFGGTTLALQRSVGGSWVDVDQSTDGATVDQAVQFTVTALTMRLELYGIYRFTCQAGSGISITAIELDGPSVSIVSP